MFHSTGYQQIVKHPKQYFKDSSSAHSYLIDLRNDAIAKGYLLASIDSIQLQHDTLHTHFYLGEKFKQAAIRIEPDDLSFIQKHSRINEKFISSVPFTPHEISNALEKIQSIYLNNGFPFIKLRLEDIQFSNTSLDARLDIDSGLKYTWTKIHVKGDSSISRKYIEGLIHIKEGDEFSERSISKISNRIAQVPFIEEIKQHELLFTKEGVELFLYVKNIPISSINGIIGLQPNPTTQQLSVTGEIHLKLLNVLRRGELLDINWQSIRDETQSLAARANYPFLFHTPFGLDGSFNLYKRDTSFLELKTNIGVQYFMNHGSYFKAFYQNVSSDILSGGANNPSFTNLGSTNTNSYGLSYVMQEIDYLPNPSKGIRIEVSGSAGSRSYQVSDTSLATKSIVYRGDLNVQWFIPIAKRHTIRIANQTEFYTAESIFENELYRFGGLLAQRGFNEDELFATTRSSSILEYRFLLDKNSHVFAFYDQTIYENTTTNYLRDTPFGFGVGFSFSTNLGVFSISYALGKQFNNAIQFNNSKIHFGYIAYF